MELSADDPLTVSLRIDVLRLEGKSAEARKLAPKVDGAGPDADRARALLDLLEAKPSYSSVIDRLRSAARSERKLGRAQALLVYALLKADKKDDAKKELDALKALNGGHKAVAALSARLASESKDDAGEKGEKGKGKGKGKGKEKPKPTASRPEPTPTPPRPLPGSGHFEFDEEPDHPAPVPDPAPEPTPEPTPDPAPAAPDPAPAPAPGPAPIDTTDLPE